MCLARKLVDLPVPQYWLGDACFGIAISVVIAARPDEDASVFI
jgi:hypothetical protein